MSDSRRRQRRLLSSFFVLHFGSVLWYVAPTPPGAAPGTEEEPAAWGGSATTGVLDAAAPVAAPWLDMTAARQHWTLFAPHPVRWTPAIEVVAWYPEGDGIWRPDTLDVEGAPDEALELRDRRAERVHFNLGYEGWGTLYRPFFADYLCRTRTDGGGALPGGLEIRVVWDAVPVPWERGAPADHIQRVGGFTCSGPPPADAV